MLSDRESAQLRNGMRRTVERHDTHRSFLAWLDELVDEKMDSLPVGAKAGEDAPKSGS